MTAIYLEKKKNVLEMASDHGTKSLEAGIKVIPPPYKKLS